MKVWFVSDTHFGHAKIIEYEERPFTSASTMDEELIERWNDTIAWDDHIFHLGDFGLSSFEYLESVLKELKGYKTLIRGNHDGSYTRMRKIGFDSVAASVFLNISGFCCHLTHQPAKEIYGDFNIHGHVHSTMPLEVVDRRLNVSCEVTDYKPISEKQIANILRKYEKSCRQEAPQNITGTISVGAC